MAEEIFWLAPSMRGESFRLFPQGHRESLGSLRCVPDIDALRLENSDKLLWRAGI